MCRMYDVVLVRLIPTPTGHLMHILLTRDMCGPNVLLIHYGGHGAENHTHTPYVGG